MDADAAEKIEQNKQSEESVSESEEPKQISDNSEEEVSFRSLFDSPRKNLEENIPKIEPEQTTNFINRKNIHGYTPLHTAVNLEHVNLAKILLEGGADPNIPNLKGV